MNQSYALYKKRAHDLNDTRTATTEFLQKVVTSDCNIMNTL